MFKVKVRDHLFIAHSLKDDFFGPAKNLHGATYVIDLIIASQNIDDKLQQDYLRSVLMSIIIKI